MTLILLGEVFDQTQEVDILCTTCYKSVGRLTLQEAGELACKDEMVLCFECEGAWGEVIPKHLVPLVDEAVILRNDKGGLIRIEWDDRDELKCSKPRQSEPSCLSSCPYLSHDEGKTNKEVVV